MKKYLIMVASVVALLATIAWQRSQLNAVKEERDKYQSNTELLLQDVELYKTKNNLNAAAVGVLELKLKEFGKYRGEDAALIAQLKTDNRNLQAVTTAQTHTINELRGTFKDSIVYLSNSVDTLRCIDITDPWFTLNGCTNKAGMFSGKYTNRDSLLIVSTVKYKRFLGFLWYTNKVKDRKVDVVSKNPTTKIVGFEYIEVE